MQRNLHQEVAGLHRALLQAAGGRWASFTGLCGWRPGSGGWLTTLLLLSWPVAMAVAQPTVLGSTVADGTTYVTYDLADQGGFRQVRILAASSGGANAREWQFASGTAAVTDYNFKWMPYANSGTRYQIAGYNQAIAPNTAFPPTTGTATYVGNAGVPGGLPAVTGGRYYTFNITKNAPSANNTMAVLETAYNPVVISSVAQSATAPGKQSLVQVTAALAAAPNAAEYFYARYSTDNGANYNNAVALTVSGMTATGYLPGTATGTQVKYYVFSSTSSTVAGLGTNTANSDMLTLRLNTNGGSNYGYTVSGTVCGFYGIDPTGNAGGTAGVFNTFGNAFTFLNANTVSCATTFLVTGGSAYTERPSLNTVTGASATNTITFQKSGAGANPKITATTGATSTTVDAIVSLNAADFITFDGIDLLDPTTNNTQALQMEMGYALWRTGAAGATTDGCNSNTIKNCNIVLQKPISAAGFATGIYLANSTNANLTPIAGAAGTASAGQSSNNAFTNNTIENCNQGVVLLGLVDISPYTNYDQNNNVGGTTSGTQGVGGAGSGNLIRNLNSITGGTTATGIQASYQNGVSIRYNRIDNAAGTGGAAALVQLRAVDLLAGAAGSYTVSNNTFVLNNTGIGSALRGIQTNSSGITGTTQTWSNNSFTIANSGASQADVMFLQGTQVSITADGNTWNNSGITFASTGSAYFADFSTSTPNVTLTNNMVTNVNKTGAGGTFYGYYNFGSPSSGTATITGNTISNITVTGATVFEGIEQRTNVGQTVIIGASGTGNGNTISNITGGSSSVSGIIADYLGGTSSVSYNTISTMSTSVSSGGGKGVYGVYIGQPLSTSTTSVTYAITNNNISGLSNASGGQAAGIYLNGGTTATLTSNTISTITGSNTGCKPAGIYVSAGTGTVNASLNTISGVSNNTATSSVAGMEFAGGTTVNITRNKIYNIANTNAGSSTTPFVYGIQATGGTTFNVSNNLIGDIKATNATGTNAIIGINASASTWNIYNNTIYLTSTGTNYGSSGIYAGSSNAVDLRNNIVVNTATSSGAIVAAAVRLAGTSATFAGLNANANNNLYYVGTGSANRVIFTDGTNSDQTLAAYKTRVGPTREAASVSENVSFASTTGSAALFLHINPATATQAESGGVAIGTVTVDYDGDARGPYTGSSVPYSVNGVAQTNGGGTAPDIGADEGDFIPSDMTPPTITYTALANTGSTAARTLTVTITDVNGIATGAGAPRLYYRVGTSGAFTAVAASTSPGSAPYNGTYTFSIPGAAVGSTVQYYVAAQDASSNNNVGSTPTGATGTNPPGSGNSAAYPGTPSQYLVVPTLSGTYYVGTGISPNDLGGTRTFVSLTAAANAYNTNALGGAVTFVLFNTSYNNNAVVPVTNPNPETYPITFNNNTDASSTNTLTIKPEALTNVTFVGTAGSATALIVLNGAKYITLDGSNNGTATRNWTLTNSNTSTTSAVVWGQTATGSVSATNNVVKNLVLLGSGTTQTLFGVGFGGSTISTTSLGTANNNNTMQNNTIGAVQYGIYSQGASAAAKNTGTVITQNDMTAAAPNNVGRSGLLLGYDDGATVSLNKVSGIVSSSDASGLSIGAITSLGASTVTGNEVSNAVVNRNNISGVSVSGTNTAIGIMLVQAATGINTLANNFVSGVISNGTSGDFACGIFAGGGAATTRVLYNSVNMAGTTTGGNYPSFALAIGGSTPVVEVRNNILVNTQSNGSGNGVAIGLAYSSTTGNYTNLTSNNNDLYVTPTGAFAVGQTGGLSTSGTVRTTLAAWNTETGRDASPASFSINPAFNSATDLHTTATALDGAGTPISPTVAGVTDVDIDGDARNATMPDIGADEFTPATIDIRPTALVNPATTGCYSSTQQVTVRIQNNSATSAHDFTAVTGNPTTVTVVVSGATTATLTATVNSNAGNPTPGLALPAGGMIDVNVGTLNMSAAGTYTFAISTSTTGDGNTSNDLLTPNPTRVVTAVATQPQTANFTGFTGANLSTLYPGWSEATGATLPSGTTSAWTNSTLPGSGTSAKVNLFSTGKNEWIVLPKLLATTSTTLTFTAQITDFGSSTGAADPAGMTGTDDFVEVRISTDCGANFSALPTGLLPQFNAGNQPGNGTPSNYTVNLGGTYAGQQIILAFFASEGTVDDTPDYDFHLDNISVVSPVTIDLAPTALATPSATQGCYTSTETLSVTVQNQGTTTLNFNNTTQQGSVNVVVTPPTGPTQTFTGTLTTGSLTPGNSTNVTLTPMLDMTALGTYSFAVTATVTGDLNTGNDNLTPSPTRTVAAPTVGTLSSTVTSFCNSTSATLSLTASANGTVFVRSSTDNVTFADIPGATLPYATGTITQTMYYQVQVRCATTVTSNTVTITNTAPTQTVVAPSTACAGSPFTIGVTTNSTGGGASASNTTTPGTAIPDASLTGATRSVTISGATANAVVSGTTAITVKFNITHTDDGDLDIYLVGPTGTVAVPYQGTWELSTDNGSASANYTNTVFNTTSSSAITSASAPFSAGPYKPEKNISTAPGLTSGVGSGTYLLPAGALLGSNINGTWTLYVFDDASIDTGTLDNFTLTITDPATILPNVVTGPGTISAPVVTGTAPNTTYTYTVTGASANSNTYNITTAEPGGCTTTSTKTVVVNATATWTGTNTNWFDGSNWNNGCVPNYLIDAIVPNGLTTYPVLTTGTAMAKNLSVGLTGTGTAATLSITNAAATLDLRGDLTTTNAASVVATAGTVSFTATTAQNIGAASFFNLTVTGTAPKVLNGASTVSNTLDLTSGMLDLSASNLELTGATSTITGAGLSHYLIAAGAGRLRLDQVHTGAGTRSPALFPIGTATSYNPVTVVNTGTDTDYFLAGVVTGITSGTPATGSGYVNKTWDISEGVAGGSIVALTLQWNAAGESTPFDRDHVDIVHYVNNKWTPTCYTCYGAATGASGPGPYSVTRSGYTSFSPFSVQDLSKPLPVELTRFVAIREGRDAVLDWHTASEKNSLGFEVQVSLDGQQFRKLSFVGSTAGRGSSAPQTYTFRDQEAGKAGLRYYRLRQLDNDGSESFSPVRTVQFGEITQVSLTAAPNPFQGGLSLMLLLPANAETGQLTLTDMAGRTVRTQPTPALSAGANQLELTDLTGLASGVYYLHLTLPGQTAQHLKVVKQ